MFRDGANMLAVNPAEPQTSHFEEQSFGGKEQSFAFGSKCQNVAHEVRKGHLNPELQKEQTKLDWGNHFRQGWLDCEFRLQMICKPQEPALLERGLPDLQAWF